MIKTPEGKWLLFDVEKQPGEAGHQIERWPVDARVLIDNGTHTTEPPEGFDPKVPPAPPKRVGAPRSASVKQFEAPDEMKRKKGEPNNG